MNRLFRSSISILFSIGVLVFDNRIPAKQDRFSSLKLFCGETCTVCSPHLGGVLSPLSSIHLFRKIFSWFVLRDWPWTTSTISLFTICSYYLVIKRFLMLSTISL
ncbi:hypothetical protein FKM82_014329 [Ascaphus truei]